jgi:hypothetical protein
MSNPHTPGPWNLHSPDEGDPKTGDGSFCITAQSMVIANAQPSDWHETPANARLIAAAPDLLKAAKMMQAADVTTDEINVARDFLDAAIAKAEGGAK